MQWLNDRQKKERHLSEVQCTWPMSSLDCSSFSHKDVIYKKKKKCDLREPCLTISYNMSHYTVGKSQESDLMLNYVMERLKEDIFE